jgi:hypothetical protein
MFSPPVPCSSTLASAGPLKGLRARTIGSWPGLSAVPRPSPRSRFFGKPLPNSQTSESRISKPASSMPQTWRWFVRVEAKLTR